MNAPIRRILPTLAAFAALAAGGSLVAQGVTGEWVLLKDGTEALSLIFKPAGAGRITGVMAAGGQAVEFAGTVRGNRASFTVGKDGVEGTGEAIVQGEELALTLRAPGQGEERYVLRRPGAGWSDATALARRWRGTLAGRTVSYTDRTSGGTSGGATTTHVFTFCADGTGLAESNTVVSVYVPGAGGSETSRKSMKFTWKTVTRGQEVAIAVRGEDDSQAQIALSGGEDGIVRMGEKAARLRDASGRCR